MIGKIERDTLIPYKTKNKFVNKKSIYLTLEFDKSLKGLNKIVSETWEKTFNDHPFLGETKLVVLNKMQSNLGSLMVHGFPYPSINDFKYKKCSDCALNHARAHAITV